METCDRTRETDLPGTFHRPVPSGEALDAERI